MQKLGKGGSSKGPPGWFQIIIVIMSPSRGTTNVLCKFNFNCSIYFIDYFSLFWISFFDLVFRSDESLFSQLKPSHNIGK